MASLTTRGDTIKADIAVALHGASGVEDMCMDDAFAHLDDIILTVLDRHCPMVASPRLSHPVPAPWMTTQLKLLLQRRKHAHRQSIKHPKSDELRQKFREIRKQGTSLNKKLRSEYYNNAFRAVQSSPRKHWRLLNRLLGRHTIPATLPVEVSDLTKVFAHHVLDPMFLPPLVCPLGPASMSSLSSFRLPLC